MFKPMKVLMMSLIILLAGSLFAERESSKREGGKKPGDDFRAAGARYAAQAKESAKAGHNDQAKILQRLAAIKANAAKLADQGKWKEISWDEYKKLSSQLNKLKHAQKMKDKHGKKEADHKADKREHADKKREHDGDKREATDKKREHADKKSSGKKGEIVGSIISHKNGIIIIKNGDKTMKLMPHWRGGHPRDGGGFDKAMMSTLKAFKAGDIVKIKWEHEEHNRIIAIKKL